MERRNNDWSKRSISMWHTLSCLPACHLLPSRASPSLVKLLSVAWSVWNLFRSYNAETYIVRSIVIAVSVHYDCQPTEVILAAKHISFLHGILHIPLERTLLTQISTLTLSIKKIIVYIIFFTNVYKILPKIEVKSYQNENLKKKYYNNIWKGRICPKKQVTHIL